MRAGRGLCARAANEGRGPPAPNRSINPTCTPSQPTLGPHARAAPRVARPPVHRLQHVLAAARGAVAPVPRGAAELLVGRRQPGCVLLQPSSEAGCRHLHCPPLLPCPAHLIPGWNQPSQSTGGRSRQLAPSSSAQNCASVSKYTAMRLRARAWWREGAQEKRRVGRGCARGVPPATAAPPPTAQHSPPAPRPSPCAASAAGCWSRMPPCPPHPQYSPGCGPG